MPLPSVSREPVTKGTSGKAMQIVIAGASGSGLKVLEILDALRELDPCGYELAVWVDHNPAMVTFEGHPVSPTFAVVLGVVDPAVVCAIGDPANRRVMINQAKRAGVTNFPNLIHPSAQVSRRATLGIGNVIAQNVVIQPGCKVGDFNTFNVGAVMGPLAQVGNFCTVNGQTCLASESVLEDGCYVGMGAKVMQRLRIPAGVTIGAQAFVNKAPEPKTTVMGVPAR